MNEQRLLELERINTETPLGCSKNHVEELIAEIRRLQDVIAGALEDAGKIADVLTEQLADLHALQAPAAHALPCEAVFAGLPCIAPRSHDGYHQTEGAGYMWDSAVMNAAADES